MKYTTLWDWDDPADQKHTIEVHESDKTPQWSGLLDASGRKLYKVRETVQIGYHVKCATKS